MHTKNFLVKIYAYHYKLEFNINCFEGPTDIENAIVDKLGKGDIKWEHLGEIHTEEGTRSSMGAGASERG